MNFFKKNSTKNGENGTALTEKTKNKNSNFAKFLLPPLLLAALSCAPTQGGQGLDLSCNPPSYVKIAKEEGNEVKREIASVGDNIMLACGATVKIKSIDDQNNEVAVNFATDSLSLDLDGQNRLDCETEKGKSTLVFEKSGKRIATLSFASENDSISLKEGESVKTKNPSSNEEVTAKFVRGFLTNDNKLVVYFAVYEKGKEQPIKIFIETDIANLDTTNLEKQGGVTINYTSLVLVGFAVCAE